MNKTADYDFTIIVPVFNEEDNLLRVEEKLKAYLAKCPMRACVLMVDDCSSDDSLPLIRRICSRNKDFFYIHVDKNGSLTAALKAGFEYTESKYAGYIDADLQTDPEDFNLLLPYMEKHALAMGIRAKRNDSKFRVWQSKVANSFRRHMTGDTAQDTGCPLKVFRTSTAKRYPFFTGMHRFFPALTSLQGETYVQVPVRHYPRIAGEAKFSMKNRAFVAFIDCFALKWMRSRNITNKVVESDLD